MRPRPEWLLTLGPIKQLRRLLNQNPVSLIDNFGEQKAHTCAIACSIRAVDRAFGGVTGAKNLFQVHSFAKVVRGSSSAS